MPTSQEWQAIEARYGITGRGITPNAASVPPQLGELVVITWADALAWVEAAQREERARTIGLLADLQALYPDSLQTLLAFALLFPQIDEHGWGHVDERVAAIRQERTGA